MKFLVDAQLPRRLAEWLTRQGHDALHTLDLPRANRTRDRAGTEVPPSPIGLVFETAQNRDAIANFLVERFEERYLNPTTQMEKSQKNGFAIMAIACLMIETLESFARGWANSNGKSKRAFLS